VKRHCFLRHHKRASSKVRLGEDRVELERLFAQLKLHERLRQEEVFDPMIGYRKFSQLFRTNEGRVIIDSITCVFEPRI